MKKYSNLLGLLMIALLTFTSCKVKNSEENKTGTTKVVKKSNQHKTGDVNWLSMGEIEDAVKRDPRPVMVDVYTKWCGPCKMLDKKTFGDKGVQAFFKENFHVVKFDAEGADAITFQGKTYSNPKHQAGKRGRNSAHQLSSLFKVRGYPSMVIFDKDLKIIDKIVGYRTPAQLLEGLKKHVK